MTTPAPCTFAELLTTAQIGVRRELADDDVSRLLGGSRYGDFSSAVELCDGRILLCRTEQGFQGSETTAPDPVRVEFYIISPDRTSR